MDAIHDDVAEFALLLTRLKERTERSYAALARRLDINASTLHRYCSGEAVPMDFTGIERFAALCGASPEERVELHRRWILAVAARRRTRPSEARRAATPHATRSPTRTTSPTSTTRTTRTTSPTSTVGSAARVGLGSPTDEAPEPTSPADRRPHAGRPRRWPGRRPGRPMAMAALLALALAGLTASAAGPPSGGEELSASARTTPEPSASNTHSGGGPRSAAEPSSGGGGSSASARTTPEPSASATHSGGGPQKSPASADTDPPSGPRPDPQSVPLTWTVDSQLWQRECAHDYVIAKPPQEVPPPPMPADAAVWAASQEAVHGGTTNLRITVQGRGSAAVVLEAVRVRVVNRATPATRGRIAYSMYEGCGAILVPRHFSVDLDAHRPLARSTPGNDPDRPAPAIGLPYQVSLREPEVLMLAASTESCTCDWYVDLDWSSQGRTGTVRIDDHGRPFRTTSIKGLPHYWYPDPRGWAPMTATPDEDETGD